MLKDFLEYIGVDEGRVNFSWVSAAEGGRFAELVKDVTNKVKELGPNKGLNESESGCCGCKS
ncbi:Methyl-viologen-reducing hydrogenase, delta subunit [Desulfotomaculum arcticum]|uniref:Methyl-viologen-reducing hydrogenase, delta subunit n=1 Tax=Desulfotruncus arcticus DSM 17038 TaxID=1121424 RepID=A0A1I2ZL10_9FIRM|nr:Methyl-viologen-reducing hydrogenase, delta subunit [Desulfotomaculum arcticum] [Desulfotruncus arcticus DSM 17038]